MIIKGHILLKRDPVIEGLICVLSTLEIGPSVSKAANKKYLDAVALADFQKSLAPSDIKLHQKE